ncbi:DeoR/GlpR family DNA-binding transcription regulator [Flavobacterium sp. TMP13]|uniref:DeoR/GlpR family DNA-binding transcription regulator n=1 Tax=Flavobacterium sp. TMP13 TaxID=3425950 RepID=UPI003D77F267
MLKAERHKYILSKLKEDSRVITTDLAMHLDLSEDTIRRDLNELNGKKFLKKVYGGGIQITDNHPTIFDFIITSEDEKIKIATKALPLLHDGQVIIMSGGSTNLVFAKLIPPSLRATIYTYSLRIAMQLSQHPNIDIIFIGGKMQKNAMVTIGMDVIKVVSKIKADICFIGASGINIQQGLTEIDYEVSIVKKAMMEASDKVVTMFACNKLNTKVPHVVCELSQLSTIVTDLNPKDPRLDEYWKSGVSIL